MLALVLDEAVHVPRFGYGAVVELVEPNHEAKYDLMRVPESEVPNIRRNHYVEVTLEDGRPVYQGLGERAPDPVETAIILALKYGGIDGDHHKMWVIDQIIRTLSGDRYDQLIAEYQDGEDGPLTYEWDTGIAP